MKSQESDCCEYKARCCENEADCPSTYAFYTSEVQWSLSAALESTTGAPAAGAASGAGDAGGASGAGGANADDAAATTMPSSGSTTDASDASMGEEVDGATRSAGGLISLLLAVVAAAVPTILA